MANQTSTPPRRGPMGRGPMGRGPAEKPKDFKAAMKRLLKELKKYRIKIAVSLVIAIICSVLAIIGPDKLANLVDKVSEGLVINKDNMQLLMANATKNLDEDNIKMLSSMLFAVNPTQEDIMRINMNPDISAEDKEALRNVILLMPKMSQEEIVGSFLGLPQSILKELLKDSEIKGQTITVQDKLTFVNAVTKNTMLVQNGQSAEETFPYVESLIPVVFDPITIDGVTITSMDQYLALEKMNGVEGVSDPTALYARIDEMPENVREVLNPIMDMEAIKKIAFGVAMLYFVSALFNFIQSIMMTDVSNNFARDLRGGISLKINKLPLRYFDRHQTGDILSRVTNDVDTIAQSMNQSLSTLVSSITMFVGSIIMMFVTNWIMALTAIFSSLFGFFGMAAILSKSQKYFLARQVELGKLNGHIEEIYSGLNVVKVYNGKKQADATFDELNERVRETNRKSQFLSGLMHPLMNFIGNFGYVAVCIVGALLTMKGHISFGVIVAFITYVRLFTNPLSQIAQAMTSLQSTAAAGERVFEFMDEKEMSDQKECKKHLDKDKVRGEIEFEHVNFQYDNNPKPTITDFTAKAKPGQKIAIVGPTGAGKTTMVNLLMKFYEINDGDIRIDGVSTKDLTRENIHELFTMVLQDTWLFDGTIKENIVYNRTDVTDERVREVCKEVGLDHFIKTLPHGYNSTLSENDTVSAGQRQLLTIARGMIEDAPFLILDEATSNVDTRTEELVQMAMDKISEGKTSFIIAHRLSTIKNADLILVMQHGNIVEQGNHDELMAQNGVYAELYNSQFEL